MCSILTQPKKPAIPPTHAVADTGATSVFVLKGTKMKNIWPAVTPLVINLPDGTVVRSTHICDYEIPGLPTHLEAHIVPDLTVASLIEIRVLCKAGCIVLFTDKACYVLYSSKVILRGYKDPSTAMDLTHHPRRSSMTRKTTDLPRIRLCCPCNKINPVTSRPLHGSCPAVPHEQRHNTKIARDGNIHTLRAHSSQRHKICPPIVV